MTTPDSLGEVFAEERQQQIRRLVIERGRVRVGELAAYVVETDGTTWLALATGRLAGTKCLGPCHASG